MGRLDAVWISATSSGDGDSEVISHAAPTFCIQVPMFDTSAAIEIHRNTRCVSACHTEVRTGGCGCGCRVRAPL